MDMQNAKEILISASRQYRHGGDEEFVTAYDREETERIVYNLMLMLKSLFEIFR